MENIPTIMRIRESALHGLLVMSFEDLDACLPYSSANHKLAEMPRTKLSGLMRERYALAELPESTCDLIESVGRRRGLLASDGVMDLHRAAALLRELRAGMIGWISLEEPAAEPFVKK